MFATKLRMVYSISKDFTTVYEKEKHTKHTPYIPGTDIRQGAAMLEGPSLEQQVRLSTNADRWQYVEERMVGDHLGGSQSKTRCSSGLSFCDFTRSSILC